MSPPDTQSQEAPYIQINLAGVISSHWTSLISAHLGWYVEFESRATMHVDLGHGHGGARAKAKIVKMLSSLQVPCTRARGTAHRLDLGEGRRSVVGVRARVVTARTKARVLRSDVSTLP